MASVFQDFQAQAFVSNFAKSRPKNAAFPFRSYLIAWQALSWGWLPANSSVVDFACFFLINIIVWKAWPPANFGPISLGRAFWVVATDQSKLRGKKLGTSSQAGVPVKSYLDRHQIFLEFPPYFSRMFPIHLQGAPADFREPISSLGRRRFGRREGIAFRLREIYLLNL